MPAEYPAPTTAAATLADLQRPSGAFAMLAVDQREALRNMMAEHQDGAVTDEHVRDFKLQAARILTPHASAVLIDRQFALEEAIAQNVVAPGCGLIAAADHFEPAYGEVVGKVSIDRALDPASLRARGAVAMKLLVLYRPDGGAEERIAMTEEFVEICRNAGLVSIIEPVSRKPLDGSQWDWNAGVMAAADELGSLGADLYKAEVPFHGQAAESEVREACRRLSRTIASPWVVLSSGVPQDVFPQAVAWACEEGASGFLAGRAVWASSLGSSDVAEDLRTNAVGRLERLCGVVDTHVKA
ncbi:aldolase [Sinomonas sp. G460-2]|uniref:aldolase n=1 Tax=Sinomonas sp. G460-2 TaxID=3393464 RepID=UPI0039EF71D5